MSTRKSSTYVLRLHRVIFPGSLRPQGFLSRLQSNKTIILYGSLFFFPPRFAVVVHGGPRSVSLYSSSMMKLYVSLLSRNYDIFSGFDIRPAAQPVAATFSFGLTVVCAFTPQYVHTRSIQLCAPSVSLFLSFWPHFLTCPAFSSNVNQILGGITYYITFFWYYMYSFVECMYNYIYSCTIISFHSNPISKTWMKWSVEY